MSKQGRRESSSARAAAIRAAQERKERRRNLLVVGGVVGVIVLIIGGGFLIQNLRDTTGEAASGPSASSTVAVEGVTVAAADEFGLGVGDPNAPVKVEVFEDFLCPFCQQFEAQSRDSLLQSAKDGEVYVVYRPIAFLNEYSERSLNAFAVVLNTAGPEAALKFHNILYDNQPSESGDMPDDDWLVDRAVEAGATEGDVRPGIEDMTYKQWVVNGKDDASKRKVTGTPTVFVNGEAITDATSIDDLVAKTEQAIADGQ
ncbi:DsbA family protein [Nocardioides sp.]|uniref:DsbA family protein n=1 Tax=Nocardioides sp. TaxID=35761 RepID=UPI003D0DC6C9